MKIELDFLPDVVAYYVNIGEGNIHYGSNSQEFIFWNKQWGDSEFLRAVSSFFKDKVRESQFKNGVIFIEKSTLKYKIVEAFIPT